MSSMSEALTDYLLKISREYCRVTQYKASSVGLYAVRDATFFRNLEDGGRRYTLPRFDEAVRWFMNNWPEGAVFPPPPRWPYRVPLPASAADARVERKRAPNKPRKGKK